MKKHFAILGLFMFSMLFNGCEKIKRGTLETMELWSSGKAYYNAKHIDQDSYSGPTEQFYDDENNSSNNMVNKYYYYHTDESPKSLGYTEGPHYEDGYTMWYHPDGYENAGDNGAWSGGASSNNNGGGGGGNSSCTGGYTPASSDIQLDAFCAQAYAFRCLDGKALSDPQVQAACQTYNQIKEPDAPSCPYCQ